MKTKAFTIMLAAALLAASPAAKAQSYYAFGAVGETLYGFTNETTRVTITDALGVNANHLATDTVRNRVIYAPRISERAAIYAWDFATSSVLNLTNGHDLSSIGQTWGGGGFYNGDYYLFDDEGGQRGIVKFTFGADGLISSVTKPWGTTNVFGDLGDIAINDSGIMYTLNVDNNLFSFDLNDSNPTQAPVNLGDYSSADVQNGQLFIDYQGRLITRAHKSGDWLSLDPIGPGVLERITGPSVWAAYADLSEGGIPVPEPSSALLIGLLSSLALLRRGRAA